MKASNLVPLTLRRSVSFALVAGAFLLLRTSSPLLAVTIPYGNEFGSTVDFLNINETPSTGGELFGDPDISGDALLFDPTGFQLTVGGGGFGVVDSHLNFIIQAKAGFGIQGFGISESGDVTLAGAGTAATFAQVGASVLIAVTEIDGVGVTPLLIPAANLGFVPSSSFNLPANPGMTPWGGSQYLDIAAYLASQNILGSATRIVVDMDNVLTAFSEPGTIATIHKKLVDGVGITVVTEPGNPIPEPSTLALASIGLLVAGWYGRRKMAS
jgi:hypothetical protein